MRFTPRGKQIKQQKANCKSDRAYAEGPTNFSLSSGDSHESLAETNDKLKFVGHCCDCLPFDFSQQDLESACKRN